MEVTVEMCPPDEWESMVKIFTEMEEHYYGKGIIQKTLLKNYLRNRLQSALRYSGAQGSPRCKYRWAGVLQHSLSFAPVQWRVTHQRAVCFTE